MGKIYQETKALGWKANIPNMISVVRIICVPLMAYTFYMERYVLSLCIFVFAGISDLVDGYLARKYNWITPLGKLLDPLADKLLIITALTMLVLKGWIFGLVLWVMLAKELSVIIGGMLLYKKRNQVVYSNRIGKLAAATYFVAVFLSFLHELVQPWDTYILYAATVFSLAAMVQYGVINIIRYNKRLKEAKKAE